ncbi:unnamed protein product [Knipowitschia caucasica]
MEEVKAQMKGLSREIVTELRQFQAPPMHNQPTSPWTNPRRTPYNDRDEREVEGVKVLDRGVVIVEDKNCTHPLIIGMNVIVACWDIVFRCPRTSTLSQQFKQQKVWRDAFSTCSRIEAIPTSDGLLGHIRLASKRSIIVPPRSELLVWGRAKVGPCSSNYCALVEAMPGDCGVGVAKTLVEVKKGRLPVRVCNPHPYSVTINRFERLGRLFSVEAGDVHGVDDLSLSLVEDGVVEVALVNFAEAQMNVERPPGVVDLSERADLSEPQQEQLRALLAKWGKVFAQHEEDFGRANIVQHRIPTGNADPVRERYRPVPPLLYKEVKSLLSGMLQQGVIREL